MQLENIYRKEIHTLRERFVKNVSKLDALSPLKILERGYSVTEDKSGNPVSSVKAFQAGDPLCVTLIDGKVHCNVVDVKPKEKTGEE